MALFCHQTVLPTVPTTLQTALWSPSHSNTMGPKSHFHSVLAVKTVVAITTNKSVDQVLLAQAKWATSRTRSVLDG